MDAFPNGRLSASELETFCVRELGWVRAESRVAFAALDHDSDGAVRSLVDNTF